MPALLEPLGRSPRRVPLLQGHRVTKRWALCFLRGRDVGAASATTGDWADPRTHRAVALRGILSFAKGYSMLSRSMAPLFAGLGLYCHAPGGVAAPPGAPFVSPSCAGLCGVRRRARWCLRNTRASPDAIAPHQTVHPYAGRVTLRLLHGACGSAPGTRLPAR